MKNTFLSKPTVLVADDDLFMRRMIADVLEPEGFAIEFASSGEEALSLFTRVSPNLIVLDLIMPGLDGLQTCRALRQQSERNQIPILMLTGDSAAITPAFEAGATDFMVKPFHAELLVHRLRYMLRAGETMSQLKKREEQLLLLKQAVESLPIGITLTDVDGKIIYSNPAEALIHGYTREELNNQVACVLGPRRLKKGMKIEDLQNFSTWRRESVNNHKNGHEFPVQLTSIPVRNSNGVYIGMVTACEDISERKRAEEKIHQLAYVDALTGLPNRWTFRDRLSQAIASAERENKELAVLFLDLDRFKFINDTMGHDFGDKLLARVAQRLESCMRKADTVARLGGDEFVVLLTGLARETGVTAAARRIQEAFSQPFELEGRTIFCAPSIGIAIYPEDGLVSDVLLKNADAAMYHSKAVGGGIYHFYSREMNQFFAEKMNLENQMRRALENQEFVLYYQPQVELANGHLAGVEVLVRWQHPEHGLIMPALFIGILEETGLILRLGEWVLREACRQTQHWRETRFPNLKTAINISGRQLKQADFIHMVEEIVKETGVDPHTLEFELTESTIIGDLQHTGKILTKIKDLGIRLSIDDFGTGYSSLSHLKTLPVDCIKIDRSFIIGITRNRDDDAIVEAIIRMAKNLNLIAVAEGVEMPEQVEFLRACSCDLSQGFYFSQPVTAEAINEIVFPLIMPDSTNGDSSGKHLVTFKFDPSI